MTVTISRLYNSYPDAQAAIKRLEAAGVDHGDISVLASNADGWYKDDQPAKPSTFPDRDLDGKDDRAEAAGTGAGVGAALGGTAGVSDRAGSNGNPRCGTHCSRGLASFRISGRSGRRSYRRRPGRANASRRREG